LLKALLVESDDHLIINHYCGSDLAAILAHQLKNRALISANVALLEWNASLREVGSRRVAGWSAGLREEDDFLRLKHFVIE
jgi:hypothetical protein